MSILRPKDGPEEARLIGQPRPAGEGASTVAQTDVVEARRRPDRPIVAACREGFVAVLLRALSAWPT